MSQEPSPLSLAEAEALFRSSPLTPATPWTLQPVANHRRNPRERQQFIVRTDVPAAFLSIGPDLSVLRARLALFARAYPGLGVAPLGTARQGGHDLLLQEFVDGVPLLEAAAEDAGRAIALLEKIETLFTGALQSSTRQAAEAELQEFGRELLALPLWTKVDRVFLNQDVLPFLQARLIPAAPQRRVSNGDFLSRNILVSAGDRIRVIDCEYAALTHFHGEDWLRFGYWDALPPAVRQFVDARIPNQPAWTVFLALRQLVLEAGIHGARRLELDALRWCSEAKAALRAAGNSSAALEAWPAFATTAPRIGVQLFWETDAGWSEASSQVLVVVPGFHELVFHVAPGRIHRLRLDPLDVAGSAAIRRLVVYDEAGGRTLFDAPAADPLSALVLAGDAIPATAANERSLSLRSTGNDPQLYLPPLDSNPATRLRVTVALDVAPARLDPAPAAPPAGALLGNVEQISPEAILGWAHDPARPDEAVSVDIFLGDIRVGVAEAAAFRFDLRAAGLGDGRKAFYFNPRPYLTATEVPVRIVFTRTGEPVPNGTGRLAAPASYAETDWDAPLRARPEIPVTDRLARFAPEQCPLISVIVPVYNSPEPFLEAAVHSVLNQAYSRWELLLVDDGSPDARVRGRLQALAALDPRIILLLQPANQGISAATNAGLQRARGSYAAFLDHDDELTADALAEVAVALLDAPETDVVYTDQDKSDENGRVFQPFHKPAWSPVYFLGVMYVGHLLVARTDLVRRIGGCDSRFDRVQDFELMLRLGEQTARIVHLPKILYHWRTLPGSIAGDSSAKGTVDNLQAAAVQAHLDRRRIALRAASHPTLPHRVQLFPVQEDSRLVSIIIPSKDAAAHISRCLDSIFRLTTHRRFEVIVVDNGTTEPAALAALAAHPIRRIDYPGRFNFSRANNLGAAAARGEVLLFLNNDTEVITPDWLQLLLAHLALPQVGAVAPLLLYPHGTVQHAGVALGLRGTCDHVLRGADPAADGYAGSLVCAHEVSSLTAACLMLRRDLYRELGGMEEAYAHIYQDADLCLRIRERGLANLYVPHARLYHHESVSRGQDYDFVDRALLIDRWNPVLQAGDPYYNRNFTRNRPDYVPR